MSGDEPESVISEAVEAVRSVAEASETEGAPKVSISVGLVTVLPGLEVLLEHAYQAADQALYRAKDEKSSEGGIMVRFSYATLTRSSPGTVGARNSEQ